MLLQTWTLDPFAAGSYSNCQSLCVHTYATAIGWLVFFLAVIVTLIQLRLYDFGEVN